MFRNLVQKTSAFTQTRRLLSTEAPGTGSTEGKFWKITLNRSPIGLPPKTRQNTLALGLKRRGHISYRPISNEIAGMIIKVKEIVKVELVDKVEPHKIKAPDGFEVIGRLNPQIAPGSKAAKPLAPLRQKQA
ncbi:39S ribosomal protein L33, mitochondrial [Dipsacomyces acuminosporus]|nr:39S ribosomal protein L33, mitochondrial [Dipsacomyces acuminosporus]